MATKVLSIEIGKSVTNVAEMDYRSSKTKIYNRFSFETPVGIINDGAVTRSDLFTTLFKNECEKYGIKTKKAVFVVSSSRLASRDAQIPYVKDKKIQEVVNASATDFFPVDMNQYHIAYNVVEKVSQGDDKCIKLNVLAVPNDLTAGYFDMAASLGLELIALDYVGNAVVQTIGRSFSEGVNAIVKIEEENALVIILNEGKIALQRTLNYGVEDAIDTVRECNQFGENLSYMDALKVLSGKTVIRRSFSVPGDDYTEVEDITDEIKSARIRVTDSLRYLVTNVGRVLEYYTSRNGNVEIQNVAITGIGAEFSGLSKLMSSELNQKVKVFQQLENALITNTNEDTSLNINAYAACIGAGICPMNLIPEGGAKAAANGESSVGDIYKLGAALLLVSVIVSAFLWFSSASKLRSVKKEEETVQQHITQLEEAGVREIYVNYETALTLNEQINQIQQSTKSRSEDLVEFIEELEAKLPSDLLVGSFSATPSGVSMGITCASKEVAAKTLMQLRTFDSVEVVSTSGLSDSTIEDAEYDSDVVQEEFPVSFTVELVYKPIDAEETEGGTN